METVAGIMASFDYLKMSKRYKVSPLETVSLASQAWYPPPDEGPRIHRSTKYCATCTTRWTLLSPPDGLNEHSSVIHGLIFGDEGDDTAAVPQVGYETIVATVAELLVEVVDFARRLHRCFESPSRASIQQQITNYSHVSHI